MTICNCSVYRPTIGAPCPLCGRTGFEADDVELERVKAFAKARGLEVVSTVLIASVIDSQNEVEKDIQAGQAKLYALARRLRTLAMFQMDGLELGERRKLRTELYEIADAMEEL